MTPYRATRLVMARFRHTIPVSSRAARCSCGAPATCNHERFPLLLSQRWRDLCWPMWIPWAVAEQAWKEYDRCGHGGQSLEWVAKRGGFSPEEIDALLAGGLLYLQSPRKWDPNRYGEVYSNWERASGECVCDRCGLSYWQHPPCPWFVDRVTGSPWLHRLCNGKLVKL